MPPFQRTETVRSWESWWSDSNPLVRAGPTMNIHAAAKPLMKLMYHRQAMSFIEQNRNVPLSEELVELYASYVSFKYVWPRTETAIFAHLRERASDEADAERILSSSLVARMSEMPMGLKSRSSWPYYRLLGTLVAHRNRLSEYSMVDVSQILRAAAETDADIFDAVISTLTAREERPADLGALSTILLDSRSSQVRSESCRWISTLADHEAEMVSALGTNTIERLVGFLRDREDSVVENAILALAAVSRHPDRAALVLSTDILEALPIALDTDIDHQRSANSLILTLSEHEPEFISAVQSRIPAEKWQSVPLLRDIDEKDKHRPSFALVRAATALIIPHNYPSMGSPSESLPRKE